jgi:hypothetical protein
VCGEPERERTRIESSSSGARERRVGGVECAIGSGGECVKVVSEERSERKEEKEERGAKGEVDFLSFSLQGSLRELSKTIVAMRPTRSYYQIVTTTSSSSSASLFLPQRRTLLSTSLPPHIQHSPTPITSSARGLRRA